MSTSETRPSNEQASTDFGFRRVRAEEKSGLVREVFDSVAGRYDVMNDVMSAGLHRAWKRALIDWLAPRPDMHLVDLAGGTGDIAQRFLTRARAKGEGAGATIVDINQSMLAAGRQRNRRRQFGQAGDEALTWLCADAEALPFADASIGHVTMAFGIRNCTDIDAVLREIRRVLRPGGRFICLEFSRLQWVGLGALYDAYSFKVIPALGQLIANDRAAYQYLVESIRKFPDQQAFAEKMQAAGLGNVRIRNLSGGVAALHSAWVL